MSQFQSYMTKVVAVNLMDIIPKIIQQHLISATIREFLNGTGFLDKMLVLLLKHFH